MAAADYIKKMFGILPIRQQARADDVYSSLLDALNGSGEFLEFADDADGRQSMRNAALGYPALVRCATLLSSVIAQLVTNGSMRVVASDGSVVESRNSDKALKLFSHSLDGYFDSYTSIEDLVVDYVLEGNALALINRNMSGGATSIIRMAAPSAETYPTKGGGFVYRATQALNSTGSFDTIAPENMAHIRLPYLYRTSSGIATSRQFFAPSPVRLLHRALQIAIASDKAIRQYFISGQRSNLGIAYPEKISTEQMKDLRAAYTSLQRTGAPFVVDRDARFTNLDNSASNADSLSLREFQVSEVSRIFGIPGPLLNQNLTSWGQGIAELAKLAWRFGISQHCERFLAPFNFRLLNPGERFKVDPSDLLRGDPDQMARFLMAVKRSAQQDETLTREEQRLFAGYPIEPLTGSLREALGDGDNNVAGGNNAQDN